MATITCAISGIRVTTDYLSQITLSHTVGYFHPVFAADNSILQRLYSQHTAGKLTPTDSYLLFLALLNSSESIYWKHPVTLDPASNTTRKLIENNISQLISVLARTAIIQHPSFKQPEFIVTYNNSNLAQIPNWIEAWEDNITHFNTYRADTKLRNDLSKVENNLSRLILSGESPEKFSHIIADWAAIAGDFPVSKREEYKRIIRSCFNTLKMFNTPLTLLKELKDYCECNIEAGSIHFHTLIDVLNKGIHKHIDYLGGSSLALGYTILPEVADSDTMKTIVKNEAAVEAILKGAPDKPPVEAEYDNKLDFLKAKLAYRTKMNSLKK